METDYRQGNKEDVKMKIEKLKPGMVVFSVGKMRMGNTAIKTVVVHPVAIKSIDMQSRRVVASWNIVFISPPT